MFRRVSNEEWRLGSNLNHGRRERLLTSSFETIVDGIVDHMQLCYYKRESVKAHPGSNRVTISISVPESVVDLFHNGAGGYRAQFYVGITEGERANRSVIDALLPILKPRVEADPKRGCPWVLVEASLSDVDAKVWIHQGSWLRWRATSDRNLQVQRWIESGDRMTLRNVHLPVWAQLTPASETRLKLCGGAVDAGLRTVGAHLKPYRSMELNDLGFT